MIAFALLGVRESELAVGSYATDDEIEAYSCKGTVLQALLADAHGDEVTRRDVNLSFQLALHGLRQSANARSAHFLRSLPRRDVTAGIVAHDTG